MQSPVKNEQYVDEYRKISTMEKLPPVEAKWNAFFEEEKDKDKNKFMRFRKEPSFENTGSQKDDLVFKNSFVQSSVSNDLDKRKDEYFQKNDNIRDDINYYKMKSSENADTNRNNGYQFYYGKGKCPQKTSEESVGKDAYNIKNLIAIQDPNDQNAPLSDDNKRRESGLMRLGKSQYNFHEINQKRLKESEETLQAQLDEEDQNIRIRHVLDKYNKFESLRDIHKMNEVQMNHEEFTYELDVQDDTNLQKYFAEKLIYNSVLRNDFIPCLEIEYFRDIGLPSWNMTKYGERNIKNDKDNPDQNIKEKAHYLHLLKENQLNINKKSISFADLGNIVTGRILPSNAYLCIRSQKVTRAQFQKLLKKLNKYKKQEVEKGKKVHQNGTITDDIDNMLQQMGQQKNSSAMLTTKQFSDPLFLVNQILKVKGDGQKIRKFQAESDIIINRNRFQEQNQSKIEALLKRLYNAICIDPKTFPLSAIDQFVSNPDKILKEEHQDGRYLWFILDCLQEIKNRVKQDDNIFQLLNKKSEETPVLRKFKGPKLLKQEKITVKQLYTYKEKSNNDPQNKGQIKPSRDTNTKPRTPIKQTVKKVDKSPFKSTAYTGKTQKKKLQY